MLLLAACTSSAPVYQSTIIGPTVTYNPNASPSPTPFGPQENIVTNSPSITPETNSPTTAPETMTPAPTMPYIPPTYMLSVTLDYSAHALTADETIDYQNTTGQALTDMVLAVEPNLWANCLELGNLTLNGSAVNGMSLVGDRLEIPLAKALSPGDSISLFMHFELHLPETDRYHVFGYNDQQTNLVDWYPFIVPYVANQGWLLHAPANVGEHLVYDTTDFDMVLHLTGSSTNAIIAAGSPPETISYGWHYHIDNVRTFAFSASPEFETVSMSVNGTRVTSYFFDGESTQGQVVLDEVSKALVTFDDLFGQDQYPKLSIVESPFYEGMEYDGLFFLSKDYYNSENANPLNNMVDIAVHETAHQWWFGSVGNDQALEPWLDEALATYSEKLFYEQNYPDNSGWQSFRIDTYNPTGWVDMNIYQVVDFRTYTNAVYLRGAQFLQSIRDRIGDDAFFAFLKDYASEMAGKRATSADFFRILRQNSSADLSDIIPAYFQNQQ